EDPMVVDRRPPSERFADESEVDTETTTSEEKPEEKTVETKASETTETQPEPDWWEKMTPEEQRRHATGLQSEVSKIRETRRDERDENERRIQKMLEDKLSEFKSQGEAEQEVPDPDLDSDEYVEYWKGRETDILARENAIDEQQTLSVEDQRINSEVIQQEQAFHKTQPDYYQVVQEGREAAVNHLKKQYELERNPNADQLARQRVETFMGDKMREIIGRGGDVAAYAYQEAKSFLSASTNANVSPASVETPTKPSGESTAEAIAAGEKASKGLGKGGSGASVGELTPESISHIRGEEFDKALDEWENRIIGQPNNWTP
ncbi:hypothetical protein LCGC14_2841460, partial [marine sediment metagenome]